MTTALELLKRDRRVHEVALNGINAAIDALEGSQKPVGAKKRVLTEAGRRKLSQGAKRMWRLRRAKAKAAKKVQ